MENNQIFVRMSFTEEDYLDETNQILIPYDESLRDDVSQIKNFFAKEWIIFTKDDRSEWIYHRPENDGPAFEDANGDKYYYLNGKLHRENGPAIEWADGNKSYWLNDKYFKSKSKYLKALRKLHEK